MRRYAAALAIALFFSAPAQAKPIAEESVASLRAALDAGQTSSTAIVRAYLRRIAKLNHAGPRLNAVIAINPKAIEEARALDTERKAGRLRGPLHGVPVLIKDNIETLGMPTTAGSLALIGNDNGRDAPVVAALRAAGAIILGKTNMSEWANIRSSRSVSGWSAVGGLTRNPYALNRSTCGSSSGSGAAVAAGMAPAALGTETDGSVICPASVNGLVALKPSIGLVPRTHIVPISQSQDTPGPMGRTVRDVAMVFSAMIASDPDDPATKDAAAHRRDYAAGLSADALKGVRIGVIRKGGQPELDARFGEALEVLKRAGAILVEVTPPKTEGLGDAEEEVLLHELKAGMSSYLASTDPARVKCRTLADLIAFNRAEAAREMPLFGQETFEAAQAKGGLDDPAYKAAREKSLRLAGKEGIDRMLADNGVAMLVTPSRGPAWLSDSVYGDQYGGPSASKLPAVAGYPHLTVPMGLAHGLPVGLSFIGPLFGEQALLDAGYAYEQAADMEERPDFRQSVDIWTEPQNRQASYEKTKTGFQPR